MALEWTVDALKTEIEKMCKIPAGCTNSPDIHAHVNPHATKLACMFFKVPDEATAQGQPPDTVKKFNELVKTLMYHQYDRILKGYWKGDAEQLCCSITQVRPPLIYGGLWCHENQLKELVKRMETLEKTNKTLSQKLDDKNLEKVDENKLEKKFNILNKKVEVLEASVSFLKNRNSILERNCVIDNSKYAFLIQRYWKKYVLIKRIKEAAKIYKLTRNFSQFVKPAELMEDLIDCRSMTGESPKTFC